MAEFITIQRRDGQIQILNLRLITRCVVHPGMDFATVSFDIDTIEIHGRSEVKQLMDGMTRAPEMDSVEIRDRETVQQFLDGAKCADPVRKRLLRLIDELEAEQRDGWNERCLQNAPGLLHAIAHIQKAVDAL